MWHTTAHLMYMKWHDEELRQQTALSRKWQRARAFACRNSFDEIRREIC